MCIYIQHTYVHTRLGATYSKQTLNDLVERVCGYYGHLLLLTDSIFAENVVYSVCVCVCVCVLCVVCVCVCVCVVCCVCGVGGEV